MKRADSFVIHVYGIAHASSPFVERMHEEPMLPRNPSTARVLVATPSDQK